MTTEEQITVAPTTTEQGDAGAHASETDNAGENVNVDELVTGWQEDRARIAELERENFELKTRSSKSNDDDDDDDLTIDERVEKRLQEREKNAEALRKMEIDKAEGEIKFMAKSFGKRFTQNQAEILQTAIDKKTNLKEAMEFVELRHKASKGDDASKKNAGQKPEATSRGSVATKAYDPEVDGKKSISQLYREG